MHGLVPEPVLAGAVDRHQHPLGEVGGQRRGDALVAVDQEGQVARDGLGVGVGEHHVLAGATQGPGEAEHRPDGVAVGVVVGSDDQPLTGAGQDLGDLGARCVPPGGHPAHASSAGLVTSSMSRVSRAASCSVES